jgi:uncharacterized protein YidB (DUF937 family)
MDTVSKLLGGDNAVDCSLNAIVEMLGSHEGETAGLVKRFQDSGFGNIVSSWWSGENLPISADRIKSVFSRNQISAMAAKVGISPDIASSKLAECLPAIVGQVVAERPIAGSSGSHLKGHRLVEGICLERRLKRTAPAHQGAGASESRLCKLFLLRSTFTAGYALHFDLLAAHLVPQSLHGIGCFLPDYHLFRDVG